PTVQKPCILTAVSALAEPATADALMKPHLHVTNAAIGGFDILEAVADQLNAISITTAKGPAGLIQPWMPEDEAVRLEKLQEPETLCVGHPIEALNKFTGN